ncbi:hypothetical protein ATCV1_z706R [Acanthocystis turfacea chlorella virus 1]|uniref:Uncharacterized protein z706R n=1 Tax=Chlorovirus heliozoae TaxID=322019 RepID=A7K9W6_9PHYC|nr:hypothetical protein ATCV1_z706R [Acanthocystis turfacea chlorella virus 1]ABT16840.1 hypothetical protein ATCV1_z706R [Acanthocystis turfacea chlorella virus 1]
MCELLYMECESFPFPYTTLRFYSNALYRVCMRAGVIISFMNLVNAGMGDLLSLMKSFTCILNRKNRTAAIPKVIYNPAPPFFMYPVPSIARIDNAKMILVLRSRAPRTRRADNNTFLY